MNGDIALEAFRQCQHASKQYQRKKITIFDWNHRLSRKRYEIGPWLLWNISRRRRSGIAGTGLSLYARLISHFNITNMVN